VEDALTKGVAKILAKEEIKLIRGNEVISGLKEEYKASFCRRSTSLL
jgi:hypothetical protein